MCSVINLMERWKKGEYPELFSETTQWLLQRDDILNWNKQNATLCNLRLVGRAWNAFFCDKVTAMKICDAAFRRDEPLSPDRALHASTFPALSTVELHVSLGKDALHSGDSASTYESLNSLLGNTFNYLKSKVEYLPQLARFSLDYFKLRISFTDRRGDESEGATNAPLIAEHIWLILEELPDFVYIENVRADNTAIDEEFLMVMLEMPNRGRMSVVNLERTTSLSLWPLFSQLNSQCEKRMMKGHSEPVDRSSEHLDGLQTLHINGCWQTSTWIFGSFMERVNKLSGQLRGSSSDAAVDDDLVESPEWLPQVEVDLPWIDMLCNRLSVGDEMEVVILSGRHKGNWVRCRIEAVREHVMPPVTWKKRRYEYQSYDVYVHRTNEFNNAIGFSEQTARGIERKYLR